MRLKLVGNGTLDYINIRGKEITRPGGIYNIQSALRVPSYAMYPTLTSRVAINVYNDRKTSRWLDNYEGVPQDLPWSWWTHVSYLNKLDFPVARAHSHFVSADLCEDGLVGIKPNKIMQMLRGVDFLIVGEDEYKYIQGNIPPSCATISRSKEFIQYGNPAKGKNYFNYLNEWIDVENPVGAGDFFVAEFINQMCQRPPDLFAEVTDGIIRACIERTVRLLRRQNG